MFFLMVNSNLIMSILLHFDCIVCLTKRNGQMAHQGTNEMNMQKKKKKKQIRDERRDYGSELRERDFEKVTLIQFYVEYQLLSNTSKNMTNRR